MKELLEAVSTILLCTFALALVFVFKGDPNLFDKLHIAAMGMCK